MRAFERQLTHL